MDNRMEYAREHKAVYVDYCQRIASSSVSDVRRMEFAILSAHCPFDKAVAAWYGIEGAVTADEISAAIRRAGLGLTKFKTDAIVALRQRTDVAPTGDCRKWRDTTKVKGLGLSKASFAACLVQPLTSNVVCVDTHMFQCYEGRVPSSKDLMGKRYAAVENKILGEAEVVGMPAFAYQWAVWDYQRGTTEIHSFLWGD